MTGFVLPTEDVLVHPEWGVIVAVAGIDYEAGARLQIRVSHLVGFQIELVRPDAKALAEMIASPNVRSRILADDRHYLRRYPDEKIVFAMEFRSKTESGVLQWTLCDQPELLVQRISRFIGELPGKAAFTPTLLLASVLKQLPRLAGSKAVLGGSGNSVHFAVSHDHACQLGLTAGTIEDD